MHSRTNDLLNNLSQEKKRIIYPSKKHSIAFIRLEIAMASRLKASKSNAISSLSLPTGDHRDRYYSLGHHDSISVGLPRNSCLRTVSNGITPSTLSLLVVDRRIQQRYKLLTEGLVQVCRVPHAKNILEKIRFSRFLRRWEDHYITLHESDIISRDVRIELTVYSHKKISLLSL